MFDGFLVEDRPSLAQPSLRGLSYILRHKNLWPYGFVWDYRHVNTCAIGLSKRIWPEMVGASLILPKKLGLSSWQFYKLFLWTSQPTFRYTRPEHVADAIAKAFNISTETSRNLFLYCYSPDSPKPEDVADAIDAVVANCHTEKDYRSIWEKFVSWTRR